MFRIMAVLLALFVLSLFVGCGSNTNFDDSMSRSIRQTQAQTYNMQQSIEGTGKGTTVPLY